MAEEQHANPLSSSDFLATTLAGAVGGFVATAPMSVAMELMHRRLPWHERYPLPPSQIVSKVAHEVGLRKHIDKDEHIALTLLAHFGYGAGTGAVYAPLLSRAPLPAAIKGILFGMCVWAASYLGLLPGLGILRPATEHPARRNALMIAAHVVWGAVLGAVTERLRPQEESDSLDLGES
jgi:uncharacterized membrane protein YagU involved in acid resistance